MRRWIIGIAVCMAFVGSVAVVRAQYNREYFFWAGRTCMMNNDYQEAIRILNTLLRFDENAYEAYFLRGIAKLNLDDLLGADADFTIAIEKNPVYTAAYTYRAFTRSRLGNYDDALKDFEEAIDLRPDLPGPYYTRGITRLLNQQYEAAIEDFNQFIRQENKVADAYINRGLGYLHLKDTLRAYENFDQAIRTNRESPGGYNYRGSLLMQQERYDEAEHDFDLAVRCDSTYVESFFNRSMVYYNTRRPGKALDDLDRVIALDSTASVAYFNRAIVRTQVGDYNRALDDYDRVALYSPNYVLLYYNRAALYARLGELEKAERDYSKAIELYPDFANAYLGRSELRYALRNPKGAERDRKTADRKIAEYKARLSDSTYSIYADTTNRFDRLLSFDSKFSGLENTGGVNKSSNGNTIPLLPLFKFTLMQPDTTEQLRPIYYLKRVEDFRNRIDNACLTIASGDSDLAADSLVACDREYAARLNAEGDTWELLFARGITQSLVKQYTNSVNTYSAAIELNPTNPFLYFNRAATRAEMIDFISSIDNSYMRVTVDADPANRIKSHSRIYNYDESIADLNKTIKLFPDFAYGYYNRANLMAVSGRLPEAFDDYTKAVELNPNFAEAYYNRGLVQIFMKDTRKGCLDISKAGELGIEQAYEVLKRYASSEDF